MQWENLTSLDFEKYVKQCEGVGIIPVGALEAHCSHLPLGTDTFNAHATVCAAAEREAAIVFPAYPYGIDVETAHLPGGMALQLDLVFALLENICDEMARNGLKKIILYTGHGGNRYYLPQFVQMLPAKRKPYVVYYADVNLFPNADKVLDADEYGHAGEAETSIMLHLAPELVKMEQMPSKPFTNLKRNAKLAEVGAYSQVDWYAQYPHMYVGDASKSTAEKGKLIFDYAVEALVKLIRAVKEDHITPALVREFNERIDQPSSPDFWTS